MILTLELTRDEEDQLRARAARQGQDVETYALEIIRKGIALAVKPDSGQTLAEVLAGRIGLYEHEGPGYQAQEGGAAFADYLAEKREKGNL